MSTERTWDELVDLNERQEYGQAWLPDREPDHPRTLVGTVRAYDQGPTSEFTGTQPWICTVEARDGKLWSIWLNRAVLANEFEKQRPMPDERIVVRYRGQQQAASRQGAQPAHLYTVTVDRDQALPGFLTRPAIEPPEAPASDIPADDAFASYGQPPPPKEPAVDVPDADVVEEPRKDDDDEPIPF